MKKVEDDLDILIADDDPDFREFVQVALKRTEFHGHFRQVEDGEQLLDYLDRRQGDPSPKSAPPRPALILLDLNMPRKNGLEALKEIRSNPELRSIPVVILSISDDSKDIQQSYLLGANTFITKPDSMESLFKIVNLLKEYWIKTAQLP